MTCLHGVSVSSGIAIGKIVAFFEEANVSHHIGTPDNEWNAFLVAQETACDELARLSDIAREKAGEDAALLFETHIEMISDPDFCDYIKSAVENGSDAVTAVSDAGNHFASMFEAMESDYMKSRAADVLDVAKRIGRILLGKKDILSLSEPSIVIAEDLSPADTVNLPKSLLLGFATKKGSSVSHTAIFSRILGIPAIVGMGEKLTPELDGKKVVLDGEKGTIIVDPDEETLAFYKSKKAVQEAAKAGLSSLVGKETVTKTGKKLSLFCNISTPDDIAAVSENDGEGIGLFRSEFLFLGKSAAPSEDEQFEAYKKVLSTMGEKPVIVRTIDIGADKKVDYFGLTDEENPALGLRGLRFSFAKPDIFKTQLRALYRASAYGNLSIMFPMVSSLWEVEKAKEYCAVVREELRAEKVPYSENVRIGVMIETPAAALISEELAQNVDFFSVGTNDLTQYTLACERGNNALTPYFIPHHPAVLSLLKKVTESAHSAGIPVGICGALAEDPEMTEFFIDIGIDELSVTPFSVLPLRKAIRAAK